MLTALGEEGLLSAVEVLSLNWCLSRAFSCESLADDSNIGIPGLLSQDMQNSRKGRHSPRGGNPSSGSMVSPSSFLLSHKPLASPAGTDSVFKCASTPVATVCGTYICMCADAGTFVCSF